MQRNMLGWRRNICSVTLLFLTLATALGANTDKTRFDSALALYRRGLYGEAQAAFKSISRSISSPYSDKATFLYAYIAYKSENYPEALDWFENFVSSGKEPEYLPYAHLFLGNLYFFRKEYPRAAMEYGLAYSLTDEPALRSAAKTALERILWGYLTLRQLQTLSRQPLSKFCEEEVAYFLAKRYRYADKKAKALGEAKTYLAHFPRGAHREKMEQLVKTLEEELKQNIVIGVLVPISGKYKAYGDKILNGVKLAAENAKRKWGLNIALSVKDTKGDPLVAADAIREIISEDMPIAIVGPLRSECAVAVAAFAQAEKVSLVIPTATRDGLASIGEYIFQLATSPETGGRNIALFAVDSLKLKRFVAIGPDDICGTGILDIFEKTVTSHGGEIIAKETFSEGEIDLKPQFIRLREPFMPELKRLLTRVDSTDTVFHKKNGKLKDEEEWPISVDGIFAPVYSDQIQTVLPTIAAFHINGTIIGANGWREEDVLEYATGYYDSLYFIPDDFFINTDNPRWKSFRKNYEKLHKEEADKLASQGYDALSIIVDGIRRGAVSHSLIVDYISGLCEYNGASGKIQFNRYGANEYTPILKLAGEKIIKVK
ncbi:MAG: hypothetical protein B6D65_05795 [candidate division Zixibacteria bacterium 4484_93]|nr:MAG: hypothetical protein B6D65_05795 [candidate division Zixibacteria bacterium 4484_93]